MSPGEVFANDPEMREGLRKPFPPELIERLDTGFKADFVGHAAVTDRLLKEAPDYTYRIDHMEIQDGHLVGILGTMTIGGKSIQEAGAVDKKLAWGEELKRAISDFIRRGAMRFGVALDLWSKEDLQAKSETPNDWDAISDNIKASDGDGGTAGGEADAHVSSSGDSEADGPVPPKPDHTPPPNGGAGARPTSAPGPSTQLDIPAPKALWDDAVAAGLTKARVVALLKKAGADDLKRWEDVTEAQLLAAIGANRIGVPPE